MVRKNYVAPDIKVRSLRMSVLLAGSLGKSDEITSYGGWAKKTTFDGDEAAGSAAADNQGYDVWSR